MRHRWFGADIFLKHLGMFLDDAKGRRYLIYIYFWYLSVNMK